MKTNLRILGSAVLLLSLAVPASGTDTTDACATGVPASSQTGLPQVQVSGVKTGVYGPGQIACEGASYHVQSDSAACTYGATDAAVSGAYCMGGSAIAFGGSALCYWQEVAPNPAFTLWVFAGYDLNGDGFIRAASGEHLAGPLLHQSFYAVTNDDAQHRSGHLIAYPTNGDQGSEARPDTVQTVLGCSTITLP